MNKKEVKDKPIKPCKIQELADYLEVSYMAVAQYPKKKSDLMKLGLSAKKYNESLLKEKNHD